MTAFYYQNCYSLLRTSETQLMAPQLQFEAARIEIEKEKDQTNATLR